MYIVQWISYVHLIIRDIARNVLLNWSLKKSFFWASKSSIFWFTSTSFSTWSLYRFGYVEDCFISSNLSLSIYLYSYPFKSVLTILSSLSPIYSFSPQIPNLIILFWSSQSSSETQQHLIMNLFMDYYHLSNFKRYYVR